MKTTWMIAALVLCLSAQGAEKETAAPNANANPNGSWQGKMKALADTMTELLPELVSNPGDAKVIERGAKSLSELSHALQVGSNSGKMKPPQDEDPSVALLADQFSDQTRRAYSAIKQGQVSYGKDQLRTVTAYCIACHTRHDNGPSFTTFPLGGKFDKLAPEQKAELYVATRQFDKGFDEFQKIINDKELMKKRPFDWDSSLRNSLAIAVRVKQDPELAAKSIRNALNTPELPEFQRDRLVKWQRAVEAWKKEPAKKKKSEASSAADMRRLFREASTAQRYPSDHAAEIQFLRASGAAHDLLSQTKNPKLIAEALMTAGAAYEVLANPVFWPMHELYYEACVRKLPHSPMALDCYTRYEHAVYFGYTGSSGTHMPADIQEHLQKVRDLAAPVKK